MNKQKIGPALFLGALVITLVALPSHSAKLQEAECSAQNMVQAKARLLEARAQQAAQKIDDQEEAWQNVSEIDMLGEPGFVDDVEVLIGEGSWLGVETNEVTAEKVKELKLPAECGVLLGKVVPDSPAAKAGLREHDVVTELNGQRVEGTAQFRRMIREIPAGRTAQLTVLRDGHSQDINVTLGKQDPRHSGRMVRTPSPGAFAFRIPDVGELPEVTELGELNTFGIAGMGQPRLGIDGEDLQGDLGTYFGAPNGEGVLVRGVYIDSPAAKAGLKVGDVITGVNGKPIRRVQELREELRSASEDKPLKVGLLRNKSELTLDVQIPARVKKQIHQRGERTNL